MSDTQLPARPHPLVRSFQLVEVLPYREEEEEEVATLRRTPPLYSLYSVVTKYAGVYTGWAS